MPRTPSTRSRFRWPRQRLCPAGRFVGLQDKLLAAVALLLTVALLGGAAVFGWHSRQHGQKQLEQEARLVAIAAASAAGPALERGEASSLNQIAHRLLADPAVRQINFYDVDGTPLGGWLRSQSRVMPLIDPPALAPSATGELGWHHELEKGPHVLVPIHSLEQPGAVGYVAIALNPERTAAQLRSSVQILGGGAMAILAVMLPLLYLLIHRAFAPIRQLSTAARNVAQGRFETVDIARGDMLGVLADTFNHMVMRLAEQKQRADEAHARLLESNLNLERKVQERTSAIEAATHRLSSEIAEKEAFLRAISHDLNAPLRNIDGIVTLLLRKHSASLPEEVCQRLERVRKNVEHESSLINDLLELSRIKTRREPPEPVNVKEMMWQLRDLFENDLREQNIEFIVESRLPMLYAEKGRIRQVFQNLIDNAIKYMGQGRERRISVGARVGRSEAEFWVRDTGAGIAPEDMDKIFYVFRRGTNKISVPGNGVGLASVKSILENYNGTIWVESQHGVGSTFRFTINARFIKPDGRFRGPNDADAQAA